MEKKANGSSSEASLTSIAVLDLDASLKKKKKKKPGRHRKNKKNATQSFEGPEKLLELWWTEVDAAAEAAAAAKAAPSMLEATAEALAAADGERKADGDGTGNGTNGSIGRRGLRIISQETWATMLELVHCKILNVISNAEADAYLLSESSFFVYPNRIVLKTCGTTTLLNAIPCLLQLARDVCGLQQVEHVFYSRKNFRDPTKQLYPHTSFDDECRYLDSIFKGSAYVLGQVNGDHWYLYHTDKVPGASVFSHRYKPTATLPMFQQLLQQQQQSAPVPIATTPTTSGVTANSTTSTTGTSPPMERSLGINTASVSSPTESDPTPRSATSTGGSLSGSWSSVSLAGLPGASSSNDLVGLAATAERKAKGMDQTLEILMTDLDMEKMKIFYQEQGPNARTAQQVSKDSGISAIFPNAIIDDFLFNPCGYSMNGLLDDGYLTIHITPQPNCSYASFETNIPPPQDDWAALIKQVLAVFRPRKFTLTLFANHVSTERFGLTARSAFLDWPGHTRSARIFYEFEHYKLWYCNYRKTTKKQAEQQRKQQLLELANANATTTATATATAAATTPPLAATPAPAALPPAAAGDPPQPATAANKDKAR